MNENTASYNHGNRKDIAFVFSVPGKIEKYNERPVCGEAGVNLEKLIKLLHLKYIDYDSYINRYDFRITNSFSKPTYKKSNNRSTPLKKEIDENIDNLKEQLKDIKEFIIFFGKDAEYASEKLCNTDFAAKFIITRHLGLQSLNKIEEDIFKQKLIKGGDDNTNKRLKVIARKICGQMKK